MKSKKDEFFRYLKGKFNPDTTITDSNNVLEVGLLNGSCVYHSKIERMFKVDRFECKIEFISTWEECKPGLVSIERNFSIIKMDYIILYDGEINIEKQDDMYNIILKDMNNYYPNFFKVPEETIFMLD